ncbi:MAG: type II secretion system F family protein [Eubacteriales bacterium]|nr:type II secretion system F family protein [Eubacteriales bacterium]MDD4583289.1 type II secretion system F family protein [Eubacteriales bacterium]
MNYKYRAINQKGKKEVGEISAYDQAEALFLLKDQGLIPLEIGVKSTTANMQKIKKLTETEKDIHEVKIQKKKVLSVLHQFAIMMKAGVSLSLCIQVLIAQEKDKQMKKILEEIQENMYSGFSLSSSMAKFKTFSDITVNIIAAGEINGRLDVSFERASQILENEVTITSKIKGALGYPLLLLGLTFLVVIILNIVVLPVFVDLFSQMGAELPLLTQVVMGISGFIISFWYILIFLILITVGIYLYARKNSDNFKEKTDHLALRVPLAGEILHKLYISRFCRIMASLVDAGVEIIHSLEVSTSVIPNTYIKKYLNKVLGDVKVGIPIHQSMSKYPIFDPLLVSMVRVGEESGMLFNVLNKMADLYEEQTQVRTKQLIAMIEPIMTIIIALVVGTVVVSVVMPMFGQYQLLL